MLSDIILLRSVAESLSGWIGSFRKFRVDQTAERRTTSVTLMLGKTGNGVVIGRVLTSGDRGVVLQGYAPIALKR